MKLLKMQSWDFQTKKQGNCEKMFKTIMKLIENQIFKKKQKKSFVLQDKTKLMLTINLESDATIWN